MMNPRTTIPGYLLLVASVATLIAHLLSGGFTQADLGVVLGALTGIGLIGSKDGGH